MSFLLDALRKSERQRRLGETPRIQIPTLGEGARPRRRPRKLLLALGLAVIALLAWLMFLQYSSNGETTSPQPELANVSDGELNVSGSDSGTDTAVPAQPSVASGPATPPVATQPDNAGAAGSRLPSGLSGENQEQPVSDINQLAAEIAEREERAREAQERLQTQLQEQAAQQEQQRQAQAEPELQQSGSEPEVSDNLTAANDASASDDPTMANPDEPDATGAEQGWQPQRPGPISYFELPVGVRQSLPDLSVNIRVYDALPENRFVIIGRERLQEGDSLSESAVKLVEIRRQSLILEYQGYVFEYQ